MSFTTSEKLRLSALTRRLRKSRSLISAANRELNAAWKLDDGWAAQFIERALQLCEQSLIAIKNATRHAK